MDEIDAIVIGAGAIGASTALHLARSGERVVVLEKENAPGLHQSSRNSGVIHAGYNVKPGTLKARFCIDGSRRLREYCLARDIQMEVGGILVVARTPAEMDVLRELERRARGNGVDTRMLDAAGVEAVEPHARGIGALHAREGASFDASGYVSALTQDATKAGADFRYGARVISLDGETATVRIRGGKTMQARCVVNAAGLFADELARAQDMRVIPFRGFYAELTPTRRDLVRSHVYAAPDLHFPFLGVHLSRRSDQRVIVGPGAMLAFGKEAMTLASVKGGGLGRTLGYPGFWRMMRRPEFRGLFARELAKSLSLRAIAKEARLLVPELRPRDLLRSFAGNRAQQVARDGKLVDDIVVREEARAVHVLNAVSPGLTCSLPFGEHLANLVLRKE